MVFGVADFRERLRRAGVYLACGLAPTLAIAAFYWWRGAFDLFWFANFRSPFMRSGGVTAGSGARLAGILLVLTPLTLPALAEWRHIPVGRRSFLGAWAIAGFISYVALGRFFEHYALPLITPLALIAAYGLRRWAVATVAAVPVLFLLWTAPIGYRASAQRDQADLKRLLEALPPSVRTGCLFVYQGPLILYHLSGACLPGRYVFSGHFTEPEEEGALERPMADILRGTLAARPAVIVSDQFGLARPRNRNEAILGATLARFYRPVAVESYRLFAAERHRAVIWRRRD